MMLVKFNTAADTQVAFQDADSPSTHIIFQ